MAYHVELKGAPLSSTQSGSAAYVLQGSVSIETAIAERPTAALSVRVPPGVTLTPQDFDELTIDYPALPYRAWAERHAALVAYWRLDEAAVTLAVDSTGVTPLTYGGGNDLQYRAFRQETSAVPYGGAPEWSHTSGAGLSGTLPAAVGAAFTVAGFVRRTAGAPGLCNVWRAGSNNSRSLRLAADGTVRLAWGGRTLTTVTGVAQEGVWHHVAATNDAADGLRLWVDGVVVASGAATTATLDGLAWQMARALGAAAVDLALDEWGIWSEAHRRGRALRPPDRTTGPSGATCLASWTRRTSARPISMCSISRSPATGSGWITATYGIFTHQPAGARFERSCRTCSSGRGSMTCSRATALSSTTRSSGPSTRSSRSWPFSERWPTTMGRSSRWMSGARSTWSAVPNLELSPLVLSGGRTGNVRSIGRTTEPRYYANRAIVVGRGERGHRGR